MLADFGVRGAEEKLLENFDVLLDLFDEPDAGSSVGLVHDRELLHQLDERFSILQLHEDVDRQHCSQLDRLEPEIGLA